MSDLGDYQGEMGRESITEAEIERLLTGSSATGGELAPLADLLAALRTDCADELEEEAIAGFVTAAVAGSTAALDSPAPAISRSSFGALKRRAAAIATAVAVVVGGTSGLALAADGAKPGDLLYGVDRALETVGIGAGAQHERLSEAEALLDAGEIQRGLQHAAEALDEHVSGSAAAAALEAAAKRMEDSAGPNRDSVDTLLSYLAANIDDLDGRQVAELAAEIGKPTPPATATVSDTPGNSPAEPPGLTGHDPGPPADKPAEPPGLSNKDHGPPDGVPANPPGHSDSKPGQQKKDH
ncbi:MAG: hypothetical protein WBV06_01340 [Acidimicrobiia bacterium]